MELARVINEIVYEYNNVIKVGEIVKIINIENKDVVLIEASNNTKIRVLSNKIEKL